jgi:NADPH-dependent 2,4-dienoyl-CoA reductase/sulfur reductase-like enzyme
MSESIDYLLIGGFAAAHAAFAIRERSARSRILLISAENQLPYDRPPLTKDLLFDDNFNPENARVHPAEAYDAKNIELRLNTQVTDLDPKKKQVTLDTGEVLGYGKLLLAPGATPRRPDMPGADYPNVYVVRVLEQSLSLRSALRCAEKVVVLGASYLGMEVASGCLKRRIDVTVIDHHEGPWAKFASPDLQAFLKQQYEAAGAKFIFNENPEKILGNSDSAYAEGVATSLGDVPADLVVAATGVALNLDLAREAGLEFDTKNGIAVDETLRSVSDPDIYVAGDAACFPDRNTGKTWHVEHYMNGLWQGETAGANMAGEERPYDRVPYFFSDFLDLHMTLRGNPQGGKNTLVVGNMTAGEFIELYYDDSGILTMGVAISHNGAKVEDAAERLDLMIRNKVKAEVLGEAAFGEYFSG